MKFKKTLFYNFQKIFLKQYLFASIILLFEIEKGIILLFEAEKKFECIILLFTTEKR